MMNDNVNRISKKIIKDYKDYLIYSDGRIFSLKAKKFLKQTPTKEGDLKVSLSKDGKSKLFSIDQLLASEFPTNSNTNNQKQANNYVDEIKKDNPKINSTELIKPEENIFMEKVLFLTSFTGERKAWVQANIVEIAKNFQVVDQELSPDRLHRTVVLKVKDKVVKVRKTIFKK